jgi:hypothetical protein
LSEQVLYLPNVRKRKNLLELSSVKITVHLKTSPHFKLAPYVFW